MDHFRFRSLVITALLLTMVVGLGASGLVSAQNGDGEYGGTLVIGTSGEPPHLNPVNNLLLTHYISGQLYASLLEYDFDMSPKPSLAESWEISEDGLTYTFNLVQNAVWTDGTPLTSADVKFSMEEVVIPNHPSGQTNFGVISSVDAPDDYTVVFNLESPFTPLISTLGHMMAPILPLHVYEGTDILENPHNWEPTVTSGPFKFEEWVEGDRVSLVRNDDYFKEGLPYLDRVVIRFIPDASTRAIALETGEIDYIPAGSLPEGEIENLRLAPGIVVSDKGFEALIGVLTIGLNTRREPLDNAMVRQALNYAADREFMVEAVTDGNAEVGVGPISRRSWAFDSDVEGYSYDPDRARELLDEAGYPEGDDGTRFSLTLTYRPDIFLWAKSMEILADNFRDVGIDVELNPLETAAYYPTVYEEWDYDVAVTTWLSGPDPNIIGSIWHSENIRPLLFTNFAGYENPEVDRLLDEAAAELDLEVRREMYGEIQEIMLEDAPAIWPISAVSWSAYWDNIRGLPPGPWSGSRDPLDKVWFE